MVVVVVVIVVIVVAKMIVVLMVVVIMQTIVVMVVNSNNDDCSNGSSSSSSSRVTRWSMLNIKISKIITGHSVIRNAKKFLFRLSTILVVQRNQEERGRPSKNLWTYLACSYKEATTL